MESIFSIIPYPIIFILFWLAITGVISFVGGWFKLSKMFPSTEENKTITEIFFMQSMRIGYFTSYSSCINVVFSKEGITLNPIILFRFLHKPIFIPWSKLKNMNIKKYSFRKIVFNLDNRRIVLFGKSAKYLLKQLNIINVTIS